jgi:hypothetical protein
MHEPIDMNGLTEALEADLVQELAQQTTSQMARVRKHERIEVKAAVVAHSGNSSQLADFEVHGTTIDVSRGGCMALFEAPLQVGDVYRLDFDKAVLDVPILFVRALRCRLVREDAFEVGFKFFSQIELPGAPAQGKGSDLLG